MSKKLTNANMFIFVMLIITLTACMPLYSYVYVSISIANYIARKSLMPVICTCIVIEINIPYIANRLRWKHFMVFMDRSVQ